MRVAILGAAHGHVNNALLELTGRANLEVVGAAEPDSVMREQFLADLGDVPLYAEIDNLVEAVNFDVALVAGVYSQRAAATLAALNAGAHVLADKPLCTSLEDLERIERAAAQSSKHVSILFEKRYHPATIALRRLLDSGVLGTISLVASTGPHKLNQHTRPEWFLDPDRYGGIAADLPVHDIDLVLEMTGATSGTVSSLTGNARPDDHPGFDDHVALLLHADDAVATIEANWLSPEAADVHGHYRMRVTGSEGTAELDWAYPSLRVATHGRETWEEPLGETVRVAAHFCNAVEAGVEPEVDTAASLLASRVALLAQRSAKSGGAQQHWNGKQSASDFQGVIHDDGNRSR